MLDLHKKYIIAILVIIVSLVSIYFITSMATGYFSNDRDNISAEDNNGSYYDENKEYNNNTTDSNNNDNDDKPKEDGQNTQNTQNGENGDVPSSEQELESGEQLNGDKGTNNGVESNKPNNPPAQNTPPPSTPPTAPPPNVPSPNSEMRGIWVSYLELQRLLNGKSEVQFRNNIDEVFRNVRNLGLNTVFVHVHSHSDSYYPSAYYPWSRYAGGNQGYDPLRIMVDKAHQYGLKIHAWFNPYRVDKYNNQYTEHTIQGSNEKPFLNPAKQEVVDLITNAVREVVTNYNVDGIQFDDYFYATTETGVDLNEYQSYLSSGGTLSQPDWRRSNVDRLVQNIYNTVNSIKPHVQFGISPQGNNRNNFNSQYANVTKWAQSSGYVDYIAPQLYWGFEHRVAAFDNKMAEWSNIVTSSSVKMYIGLAPYRSGKQDTGAGAGINEWINNKDVIARQIKTLRNYNKQNGFILFDYRSLFNIGGSSDTGYAAEERENIRNVLSGRSASRNERSNILPIVDDRRIIFRKFFVA